ncbi:CBS domain-containing protein [Agriterribacter sp.]|uniref:CBS domain-containing protein n=1 Tax=Agriterribacter sp. TaxID=2821509 RepID=UPI002BFB82D1|nr:CBS domain-containing protein [Agriterribacter sp.]HRP55108.1 CBS domain-containing protein [Agriterribacter sp.]
MFAGELISRNIPTLHLDDNAGKALQEMNDFHVCHLPVADEDKYLGLISEDDLLDNDENVTIESLKGVFIAPFVLENDFFLLAVKRAKDFHLSVVPVITEQYELLGAIGEDDLFRQLAFFAGIDEQGGVIILEMEKNDFSAGELNRLIESNDAYITQLNSFFNTTSQLLTITLRINKAEISDIVATLQRHEYNIKYYYGEELYQNELQNNFAHLMNYLNI